MLPIDNELAIKHHFTLQVILYSLYSRGSQMLDQGPLVAVLVVKECA